MPAPETIQTAIDRLPRVSLADLPTPLHFCERLSAHLGGPRIFIKRDDLTGLAFGGNKTRYLEFTLGEAVDRGANAVVLSAVVQSNHCRQFAAAAAKLGIKAVLVLRTDKTRMGLRHPPAGNHLLGRLFGADIRFADRGNLPAAIEEEMARLRREGYRPFTGLSAVRSRVAYIQCALELARQSADRGTRFNRLIVGSGSNTLAGLVAGFGLLGADLNFTGIPQSPLTAPAEAPVRVAKLAQEAADLLGFSRTFNPERIAVEDRFAAPGFGLLDETTREAVRLLARTEGIVLDPTYTGKGFAALVDAARAGRIKPDENVVFVHTGGTPLVFVYGEDLVEADNPKK